MAGCTVVNMSNYAEYISEMIADAISTGKTVNIREEIRHGEYENNRWVEVTLDDAGMSALVADSPYNSTASEVLRTMLLRNLTEGGRGEIGWAEYRVVDHA